MIPSHLPCERCGCSVAQAERKEHVCDPDKVIEYEAFVECLTLEQEIGEWLQTAWGRFEVWYAERGRGGMGDPAPRSHKGVVPSHGGVQT